MSVKEIYFIKHGYKPKKKHFTSTKLYLSFKIEPNFEAKCFISFYKEFDKYIKLQQN